MRTSSVCHLSVCGGAKQEQAFMRDFSAFANAQAPVNGTAGNITSWSWRA